MRTLARRPRPKPRLEKHEQAEGVRLLEAIGAKVYVLGTRRPKGDYPGTRQTPGIADVLAFLPLSRKADPDHRYAKVAVWFEFKRSQSGTLSEAQSEFRDLCVAAAAEHVVGDARAVADYLKRGGWLI